MIKFTLKILVYFFSLSCIATGLFRGMTYLQQLSIQNGPLREYFLLGVGFTALSLSGAIILCLLVMAMIEGT